METALKKRPTVFGQEKERQAKAQAAEQSEFYEQIGRLQMELAAGKKSCRNGRRQTDVD